MILRTTLSAASYGTTYRDSQVNTPQPLIEQLKPGGRMVIPVGMQSQTQYLTLVTKLADGKLEKKRLLPVRFVPLTRE
nr:protein-L-isoaspartate O-methyltransferase [Aliikangiella sp. G2MR2-5]